MSVLKAVLRFIDRVSPPGVADAHCDIPCGIYDPHAAQVAAHTVIRMFQLMQNLEKPAANAGPEAQLAYDQTFGRYVGVKEEHAKIVEQELTILWTDYFRPEHLEKYPNLHDLFWKTMKLTSTVKQQVNPQAAQDLLAGVQQIAEVFWATKGVQTRRQPSGQPTGGEIVYPAAA